MELRNNIDINLSKTDTAVLKGIAICGMLCWHLFYCSNPCGVQFGFCTRWIGLLGDVCVSAFLFASGYGLAKQFAEAERGEWGGADIKFIIRRFMKFYSGYWVILAICLPIGILLFDRPLTDSTSIVESAKIWTREIFAFSGHSSYNATWWFNALILSFYLLFPILYYGVKYSPILALVISYVLRHSVIMKISMDMGYYMFIFVVGIVLAVHCKSIQKYINVLPKWLIWVLCLGLIAGSAITLILKDNEAIFYNGLTLFAVLTVGLVLLIVMCIRRTKIMSGFFSALGKHSANIYLIHTLIFYYWFPEFFYSLKYPIVIFSLLMAICFGISWVLEKTKEIVGYNKLTNAIIDRIK